MSHAGGGVSAGASAAGSGAGGGGGGGGGGAHAAPYVKPYLSIKLDPLRGRCVVAERGIPAGTLVMLAEPYAAVAAAGNCGNCLKASENGLRCSGCSTVSYCGAACQKADWHHHRRTCVGLRRVMSETTGHAAPATVQLAVEAFFRLAADRAAPVEAARAGLLVRELDADLQEMLLSGGGVLALEAHRDRLEAQTLEGIGASALMMAKVMSYAPLLTREGAEKAALEAGVVQVAAGARERTPKEEADAREQAEAAAAYARTLCCREGESELAAVLRISGAAHAAAKAGRAAGGSRARTDAASLEIALFGEKPPFSPPTVAEAVDMFCRMRSNVFSLCDAELRATGIGIYPLAALLNHSCEPNCIAVYRGRTQSIRTIRHVRADEELTLSYCDVGVPTPVRLQGLREGYFFTCHCRRCDIYVGAEETLFLPPPPPPVPEDARRAEAAAGGGAGGGAGVGGGGGAPVSAEDAETAAAIAAAEEERARNHAKFSVLAATVGSGAGAAPGAGAGAGRGASPGGGVDPEVADAEDGYMKALLAVQLAETESLVRRLRSEASRLDGVIKEILPPESEAEREAREREEKAKQSADAEAEGEAADKERAEKLLGDGDDHVLGSGASVVIGGGAGAGGLAEGSVSSMSRGGAQDSVISGVEFGSASAYSAAGSGAGAGAMPDGVAAPRALQARDAETAAAAAAARAQVALKTLSNALVDIGETPPAVEVTQPGRAAGSGSGGSGGGSGGGGGGGGGVDLALHNPSQLARRVVRHVTLAAFTTQDIQLLGVRCTRRSCRGVHVMLPPAPLPPAAPGHMAAAPPPEPASTCTQCGRALAAEDSLASAALQRRAAKLVALQKSGAKVSVILTAGMPLLKEMLARLTGVHFHTAAVANSLVNASVGVRDWSLAMANNQHAIGAFMFAYPPGHPLPALQQALHGKILHFTYQPALAVAFFREALAVLLLSHGRDNELYHEISSLLQQAEAEALADPANLPPPTRNRGAPVHEGKEGFGEAAGR